MEKKKARLTYYVSECMEYPSLGENYQDLTLNRAITLYKRMKGDSNRMGPGIGFILYQEGLWFGGKMEFPILDNNMIDVDGINAISDFRNSTLVQKAIKAVRKKFPEVKVIERNIQSKEKKFNESKLRNFKEKARDKEIGLER